MTETIPEKLKLMVRLQIPLVAQGTSKSQPDLTSRLIERLLGRSLGDLGEPEDIAEMAAFLASPSSKYMTGAAINVNGGLL
jgi:NAD(P)-dependent dehydrogenase (short-subunit alcohol dehydrogenase family)